MVSRATTSKFSEAYPEEIPAYERKLSYGAEPLTPALYRKDSEYHDRKANTIFSAYKPA